MTVTTNVLPPLPDPAQRTIPEIGSIRGPASVIRSALIVYVFRGPKVGDDRQRGIIGGASCLQSLIVLVTYAPGHYRIFTAGNRAEVSHFVVDGWGKAVVVSPSSPHLPVSGTVSPAIMRSGTTGNPAHGRSPAVVAGARFWICRFSDLAPNRYS